ncbi:MAG: hypothetical protein WA705_22465 [Candidatus Ozemobacteraceae bacterium]
MSCNKFDDWLALQSSGDWLPLPDGLADHVKECSECAEKSETAQTVRREFLRLPLSESLLKTSWEKISSRISMPTEPSSSKSGKIPQGSNWQWLFRISLAFSLLLVFAFSWFLKLVPTSFAPVEPLSLSPLQILGTLRGSAGKLHREKLEFLVTTKDLDFQVNDELTLFFPQSRGEIDFADGSKVHLEGTCKIRLFSGRFQVDSGICQVSLKKGKNPLKIQVCGAVLGIRGTVLQFNLTPIGGTIDLLEGIIDVEASSGILTSFSWKAGTRLLFNRGNIIGNPVTIPLSQAVPSSQSSGNRNVAIAEPDNVVPTHTLPKLDPSVNTSSLSSVLSIK